MTRLRTAKPAPGAAIRIPLLIVGVALAFALSGALAAPRAEAASLASQVKSLQTAVKKLQTLTQTQTTQIAAQKTKIATLELTLDDARSLLALAPYIFITGKTLNGMKGPNIVFQGANVHVRDGSGATNCNPGSVQTLGTLTGLGNLVVGYNELWGGQPLTDREGSNNLIVGIYGAITSAGCLVAGDSNTVSGMYSAVLGGYHNRAAGNRAVVAGGSENMASDADSSVAGGSRNTASDYGATVAGGYSNTASGQYAAVAGGGGNTASAESATVAGGLGNTASGSHSAVGGGDYLSATAFLEWIAEGTLRAR